MSQASKSHRSSSLLSDLPPKDTWLEQGIVERRTVHANIIWRERQMILTKDYIYFARIDSDLIVDKISIRDISSIGKVDHTVNAGGDEKNGPNRMAKLRKTSVLTNISRTENFECFNDAHRESFPFEIKIFSDGFQRSYFVRVPTLHECESWISSVTSCWKSTLREFAEKHSWVEKRQREVRNFISNDRFRRICVLAIILDFFSSVFRSEILPKQGTKAAEFFDVFDFIFFAFFSAELLLNIFGNWRSVRGSPFVNKSSNWFQIITVLAQIIGLIDHDMKSIKVIRIMRVFDVGASFKSLGSCRIVLKAIRRGTVFHCRL